MITCTVCGTPNEDLAVVCSSCRSYLQGKVDTLNLFQTIWGLAEAPRATMRRVLLARHKNYTLFLSALFGVACAYGVFWLQNAAARFDTIFSLTLAGMAWGPVFGVLFTALLASVAWAAGRVLGQPAPWWNVFAVTSYAAVPVVLTLFFVYPVEVAVFGIEFFGTNPPPMVINPVVYVGLIAFDTAAVILATLLLGAGAAEAHRLPRWKAALVAGAVLAAALGILRALPPVP